MRTVAVAGFTALILALAAVPSARAAGTPAQKCAAAKLKAAGKKVDSDLKCHAKATGAGGATEPACLTKANDKFAAAFLKVDLKGGCLGGDPTSVGSVGDVFVGDALAALPGGISDDGRKCAAAKLKAAGKKVSSKLKCQAKAAGSGATVDPACLTKAESKFTQAFLKAEAKGGCTTVGDGAAVEALVDSLVATDVDLVVTVHFATQVQPIFSSTCALGGCHSVGFPAAGMNLTATQAYANIVNVASTEVPALVRVAPGNPADSYLHRKITNAPGIVGSPMPIGGYPMAAQQIEVITTWIAQGALDN